MPSEAEKKHIAVVGGGTSGAVIAARLSEDARLAVTLLEAGADHDSYDEMNFEPRRASDNWRGGTTRTPLQPMASETGLVAMIQGRVLGGTSAFNGLATLRGQPEDYDGWAAAGLEGWGWDDVKSTFIAAERDVDFGATSMHGADGPLPVRRWTRDEISHGQAAFYDGMVETGHHPSADINDPGELPGVGVFPVTIDEDAKRVSTSLAYLTPEVRARPNLTVRTHVPVARVEIEGGRARGVVLESGEEVAADEVVVTAGAIPTAAMLLRSGVGPKSHLEEHGLPVFADLPVGETMADHLGAGIPYRHPGPRGGIGGPAQIVLVGSSDGKVMDYHLMPISIHDPVRNPLTFREKLRQMRDMAEVGSGGRSDADPGAASVRPGWRAAFDAVRFLVAPTANATMFVVAALLLRSSGRGSVRLGDTPDAPPVTVAPPFPEDAPGRFRHALDQLVAWERSEAFRAAKVEPMMPHDLSAPDAIDVALERNTVSYGHMVGTCPMGTVLDADCRVHGIPNLRVADASVMPTIPAGNTYLGCVMVAERVARKMKGESR
jgi:choline dehydrogenase